MYTCKSLQELDQADVYAPRKRHSHASGGDVSLFFRCVAPLLYFSSYKSSLCISELRSWVLGGAVWRVSQPVTECHTSSQLWQVVTRGAV